MTNEDSVPQVAHGLGHVLDGADPSERHLLQVVVEQRAAGGDGGHELVVDDPGRHGVDPDAERAELLGGRLGEEADAGLGHAVGPQVRMGETAGARGHEDDGAGPPWACMAAAPCFTQMTEPIRLRSMVARTAATSAVSTEPRCNEPPAQAKRPSMRPVTSAVAATAAATWSSTVTSATM